MTKTEKKYLSRIIAKLTDVSSSYARLSDLEKHKAIEHELNDDPHNRFFSLGCVFTLNYVHSDSERILAMLENLMEGTCL